MSTKQKRSSPIGSAKPLQKGEALKCPILISYHYLRKWSPEHRTYVTSGQANKDGFEIMLDSGAFSAKNSGAQIPLEEYMVFLHKNGYLFKGGYVALDVLGDVKGTEKNLEIMYDNGLKPMPVHVWGDNEKRMDYLFERANKICFGGLRRPQRGSAPKEYVVQKMKWAKGRDVHWLGYTNKDYVTALLPHSVDSASFASAMIWGTMSMYLGSGMFKEFNMTKLPKVKFTYRMTKMLEEHGIVRNDLYKPETWRSSDAPTKQISTDSWVRYVCDLRRVWGVRHYLALSQYSSVCDILKYFKQEKQRCSK